MPHILPWSPGLDARLCRLRREGESWNLVAADLRMSPLAVRARARRLGLPDWCVRDCDDLTLDDPKRAPLPTGHERAWKVLTDGTLLEGTCCQAAHTSAI